VYYCCAQQPTGVAGSSVDGLIMGGVRSVSLAVKRAMDVVGSLLILLLAFPVLVVVAVLISVRMGAPILFTQRRPGLHGKVFVIYKFRTMLDLRDDSGNQLPDEQRLTSLGRFLRATSLDELPQLLNVLKGDMSLVGPRPLPVQYLSLYSVTQARRHEMRPGITGWAQVSGRNAISWQEKFTIDVLYVDRWNLWIDLRILLSTALAVIRRTGITQCGHATVECFRGNELEPSQVVRSA
jgi:sugar transferase EpsL